MVIISGTNRPGSNTKRVSLRIMEILSDILPKEQWSNLQLLDLIDIKEDLFLPSCYEKKPSWFLNDFQKPISNAKAILVVTPEYNGSFPGVLKYFIDMLEFPSSLQSIPTAFVGLAAGQFGGLRAVEQLETIFSYRKAHIFGERVVMPAIHKVISPDGTLGEYDEQMKDMLSKFIDFEKTINSKKQ